MNPVIRQDLLPLTGYHEYLEQRGLSEALCDELGIGFWNKAGHRCVVVSYSSSEMRG